MKKNSLLFLVFLFIVNPLSAQISIGLFSGYGQSSFDEDIFGTEVKLEQAGYLPAGLQLGYDIQSIEFGSIFLGAELNYAVSPFTFELGGDIGNGQETLAETKIDQFLIGVLFKLKFGKGNINPFVRLGGGAYMGSVKTEYKDKLKNYYQQLGQTLEDEEQDLKTAFGFNVGAGADFKFSPSNLLFLEFVYHIVSREADAKNAESFGANNWAAQVGVMFGIN